MPANIYDLVPVLTCDMSWILCTLVSPNSWDHSDGLASTKKLHVVTCNFFRALWLHVWVSYISWYVLGGMSLTCLPIFAWQWGRKHNNTEKNEVFWVKHIPTLFMTARCVFFYQCVYFFTNGVYPDFHHNIMFLWFFAKVWFDCSLPNATFFTLAFQ